MMNTDSLCSFPHAAFRDQRAGDGARWLWRRAASTSRFVDAEPSLVELLCDPAARALMRADGVAIEDVIAVLARVRARIGVAFDE